MSKVAPVSVDTVSTSLPTRTSKSEDLHPLAPISAEEVQNAVALVKAQWPTNTDLHFKAITLEEPAKAEVVPYIEAEFHGYNLPHINRRIFVSYYLKQTVRMETYNANCAETDVSARTNSMRPSST